MLKYTIIKLGKWDSSEVYKKEVIFHRYRKCGSGILNESDGILVTFDPSLWRRTLVSKNRIRSQVSEILLFFYKK